MFSENELFNKIIEDHPELLEGNKEMMVIVNQLIDKIQGVMDQAVDVWNEACSDSKIDGDDPLLMNEIYHSLLGSLLSYMQQELLRRKCPDWKNKLEEMIVKETMEKMRADPNSAINKLKLH